MGSILFTCDVDYSKELIVPIDNDNKWIDELADVIANKLKEDNIMELKNTIELMLSDNYEDRLKAEYMQLKIRIDKLSTYLDIHKVEPTDDRYTQLYAMKLYLECLEKRVDLIGFKKITNFEEMFKNFRL